MYKLKEEIKNEIVKNKQEEMTNFLDKLEKNPVSSKPFWSLINKTRAKNNSNNIPTLKKDGVEYTSDEAKDNLFAEKLKKTFNEIDAIGFDNDFKILIDSNINNKTYEYDYNDNDIQMFTMSELKNCIKKLNNSKSMDPTGLNNFILKKLPVNTLQSLLSLF